MGVGGRGQCGASRPRPSGDVTLKGPIPAEPLHIKRGAVQELAECY